MRAAVFPSADPAARCACIVTSDEAHVVLNTPEGGCWREIGHVYARPRDVPPLGELPAAPKAPLPA